MLNELTKQQDTDLQRLVRTQSTIRNIAREVGVCSGTVINYRRACLTVDAMPKRLHAEVRRLLLWEVPIQQISARLKIPVESVGDVHRIYRLHDLVKSPPKCTECGAVIFSGADIHATGSSRIRMRGRISRENVHKLYDIVSDLMDLNDLQLITNPLFYHLAQRAEKVYGKIYGKSKEEKKNSSGHSQGVRI